MILAWIATLIRNNIFYIILISGLLYQTYEVNSIKDHYNDLQIKYDESVITNKSLDGDVSFLKSELDRLKSEANKDVIEAKKIQEPIIRSETKMDQIDELEYYRGINDEEDEGDVVDIDGKLPDDLIRLLK